MLCLGINKACSCLFLLTAAQDFCLLSRSFLIFIVTAVWRVSCGDADGYTDTVHPCVRACQIQWLLSERRVSEALELARGVHKTPGLSNDKFTAVSITQSINLLHSTRL